MEAKLYRRLYRLILSLSHPRAKGQIYSDRHVVLVYLWSVLWDRPACWACEAENWPKGTDEHEGASDLISQSRLSVRLRTVSVQQLLERALAATAELFGVPLVKVLDSFPMTVGPYSHDRDAKRGRVGPGMMARGYRLHALTHGRAVVSFTLAPMNDHDSKPAPQLLQRLQGGGYVVVDNAYDSNDLHQVAAEHHHQLVAPPKEPERHVRDLRRNCPQRLRALDLLANPLEFAGQPSRFGRDLYAQRQRVESAFGGLAAVGLGALPPWVRGPRRVALWAAGKVLIHLVGTALKQRLMT